MTIRYYRDPSTGRAGKVDLHPLAGFDSSNFEWVDDVPSGFDDFESWVAASNAEYEAERERVREARDARHAQEIDESRDQRESNRGIVRAELAKAGISPEAAAIIIDLIR